MIRKREDLNSSLSLSNSVRIAAGTDIFLQEHPDPMYGDNAYELELMVRYGLSEMEAVMSATKNAAEALGLDKEIGTIEDGKSADIIIVQGDPVKDIKILQKRENIRKVVKSGRIELDRDSPARTP